MPSLANGAVELPLHHVSVRVPWHDLDYTGRICADPAANHACGVLNRIKQSKNPDLEREQARQPFTNLDSDELPPCVFERSGFMRTKPLETRRSHPYANNDAYSHFAETTLRQAPYSLELTPFRWMLRNECARYVDRWGISVDDGREERVNDSLSWSPEWLQDHRNQLSLLDSFYSAIQPGRSLVLLYAKDLPLIEEREPGARYLIGAGLVESVEPSVEWEYDRPVMPSHVRSVLWERGVAHSIRPEMKSGFLLPYQALLKDPKLAGIDLSEYIARA